MTCQPMCYMPLQLLPKKALGLFCNTKNGEVGPGRAQEGIHTDISSQPHSPDTPQTPYFAPVTGDHMLNKCDPCRGHPISRSVGLLSTGEQ